MLFCHLRVAIVDLRGNLGQRIRDERPVECYNCLRGEGGMCGLQLRANFLREALVCICVAHKRFHVGYGGDDTAPEKHTVKTGDVQRSTQKRTGHRHGPYAAGQRMPRLPNCQERWQNWRARPGVQRQEGRIQRSTSALLSAAVSQECGDWDTKHIRSRRE